MMKVKTNSKKIEEILTRGVEKIIEKESLLKKLKSGRRLRVKLGIDPTAPDLHLGNAVALWKLREFQDLGHKIIFIIGDFTARIGDPSGRLSLRKALTEREIKENMKAYKSQIEKILDLKKTEIVFNSEHLSNLKLSEMYRLFHFFSLNQILEREMFKKRISLGKPIWLHEFFYPILQAYDSVVVGAEIEVGGSDQLFNMLMGRQLQAYFNQTPQDILTMKILVGTDGKQKMSKSFQNYIGINEPANEQYGKLMSIKDETLPQYLELCTRLPVEEIKKDIQLFKNGKINPRDLKRKLAREVVSLYYGRTAALKAEDEFERVFREKKLPSNIPEVEIKEKFLNILDLLIKTKLVDSKSEAKRMISQKAIKINGLLKENWREVIEIKEGMVIKVGKRKFLKIKPTPK